MFTTRLTPPARTETGPGGVVLVAVFILACIVNAFAMQIGVGFAAGAYLLIGFGAAIGIAWLAISFTDDGDLFSLRSIWPFLAALVWISMFRAIDDWAASTAPVVFEAARGLSADVPAQFMPWWGTRWFKFAGFAIILAVRVTQHFKEHETY